MPDQLMKTFSIDTGLAVIEGRKNQNLYSAEAGEAIKWAALHELLMQIHKGKDKTAMDCIMQVHLHAVSCVSQFSAEAFNTVDRVVRTESEQAFVEATVKPLMALYSDAITRVAQIGDINIAQEASRTVPVTPPRKHWWQ